MDHGPWPPFSAPRAWHHGPWPIAPAPPQQARIQQIGTKLPALLHSLRCLLFIWSWCAVWIEKSISRPRIGRSPNCQSGRQRQTVFPVLELCNASFESQL